MALKDYLPRQFNLTPPVVKNLLIINVLVFVASFAVLNIAHEDLNDLFGLYYFEAGQFQPFQIITSMFSHGNLPHLLFNMFALWMFGSQLERIWGGQRFLLFFLITGLGASALHTGVNWYEVQNLWAEIPSALHSSVQGFLDTGGSIELDGVYHSTVRELEKIYRIPVVGASGAVYGLLMGFGMLFPNVELMLLFLPVPIKAKFFIPLLMLGELYLGINNFEMDNIAHFAHLGGALFGFIIIKYWSRGSNNFF